MFDCQSQRFQKLPQICHPHPVLSERKESSCVKGHMNTFWLQDFGLSQVDLELRVHFETCLKKKKRKRTVVGWGTERGPGQKEPQG
jgi:hypothetical protein